MVPDVSKSADLLAATTHASQNASQHTPVRKAEERVAEPKSSGVRSTRKNSNRLSRGCVRCFKKPIPAWNFRSTRISIGWSSKSWTGNQAP